MSSDEFLLDGVSRHAVLLQRYSAGLESIYSDEISKALNSIISGLSENDIESLTARRAGSLRARLLSDYRASLSEIEVDLLAQLLELAESEGEFSADLFSEGASVDATAPLQQDLFSSVRNTTLELEGQSVTIPNALSQFSKAKSDQVGFLLSSGFSEGKTQQELIREVRAIKPLQRRQAASLVRTGTNAVSSIARYEAMKENRSIFDGYEWVSTLDSRTSHICMARDGAVYKFANSSPKPPAHWSCRSTIVPKVKDKYNLLSEVKGTRPSVGSEGAKKVSAQSTYGGWLRKQPASFQNEVLGPARAKLFRQGGMNVDKFVNFDGKTYTLDELRALNPLAFEKANL